jgi:hypothetical protein
MWSIMPPSLLVGAARWCRPPYRPSNLSRARLKVHVRSATYLYSSLFPYASTRSGSSFMTARAAAFMRSSAFRSFGLTNLYFVVSLFRCISRNATRFSELAMEREPEAQRSSSCDSSSCVRVPACQPPTDNSAQKKEFEMKNANVLGEATAVDSDHDPGVGQQDVGLFKEAHVFVPEVRQSSPTRSCR